MRRRPGPRSQPAHPTRAEIRSAWAWLRVFPRRAWRVVSRAWRTERRRTLIVLAGTAVLALVLALLGAGRTEIREIIGTLALGALVLAVSRDHRGVGGVVICVLGLSLVGTLAGPRWTPEPLTTTLTPTTSDTAIGGAVITPPVGTFEVETTTVTLTDPDGGNASALLRRPVGVAGPTSGVVFIHGAGTHTIEGFAEQATALASAGVAALVPSKPMDEYSTTSRDYPAMAADYSRAVEFLRNLDGVDPARVGLYAESEGGYPGVVLAAQDPGLSFLVLASAPVVQLREQAAFAAGSYLERVGVPGALNTVIARVLGSAEVPGGFEYADFDAGPYEERLRMPVLMVYGTGDSSMPLVQGPMQIWQSMQTGGNDQLTVRYYDGANHGLKLGTSTDGALAPGVTRDLARWVTGLPATAQAAPRVAGATPVQEYWARAPGATRWYASGDLMAATVVSGVGLLAVSLLVWLVGQSPRLRGGRGLRLPDPIGRWTVSLTLSVLAAWVLYLAYIGGVVSLALSYRTNPWFSYGGWLVAQLVALGTVVLLVKLVQRTVVMHAAARDACGPLLSLPSGVVLGSALGGTVVLLVALSYWGLFPMLV